MIRQSFLLPILLVVAGLLLVSVASAREHVLLAMPGSPGSFVGGEYNGWVPCADLQYNIPKLPKPLALLSGAVPPVKEGELTPTIDQGVLLSKIIDKSSAKLFSLCREGGLIPAIKLALCKEVDRKIQTVLTVECEQIKIASYTVWAPGFGDRSKLVVPVPNEQATEMVLLRPQTIRWKFHL